MASLSEFAAAVFFAVILAGYSAASAGRELRPSDHGLLFQASPPANANSSSMRSFFNGSGSSSSADVSTFPEATNFTASLPPSWWSAASSSSSGGGGGRRLGGALVVASLVCGVTGVALLVASGLVYLFKHRRKNKLNASFRADDGVLNSGNDNHNDRTSRSANKLQLVAMPVVRNS